MYKRPNEISKFLKNGTEVIGPSSLKPSAKKRIEPIINTKINCPKILYFPTNPFFVFLS